MSEAFAKILIIWLGLAVTFCLLMAALYGFFYWRTYRRIAPPKTRSDKRRSRRVVEFQPPTGQGRAFVPTVSAYPSGRGNTVKVICPFCYGTHFHSAVECDKDKVQAHCKKGYYFLRGETPKEQITTHVL